MHTLQIQCFHSVDTERCRNSTHEMKDIDCPACQLAQEHDLFKSHVILTRNDASNHTVVSATQLSDAVCLCWFELWFWKTLIR